MFITYLSCIAASYAYVTATGSKTTVKEPHVLGYYQLLKAKTNNFPAWKLVSTTTERYLYRYTDGEWQVSDILGDSGWYIHSTQSNSPFTAGIKWKYYDHSTGLWPVDDSLQVTKFEGPSGKSAKPHIKNCTRASHFKFSDDGKQEYFSCGAMTIALKKNNFDEFGRLLGFFVSDFEFYTHFLPWGLDFAL